MKYCSKCFAEITGTVYACTAPHCGRAGVPVPGESVGHDGQNNPLCPACNAKMTLRVCPDCGFELDADDSCLDTLCYSIVGAHGSGKSNFLSVLVEQIKMDLCRVYECSLYPTGGDRTMDYFERQYRRPLFEQGVCVPSTAQEDIDPLTYTLVFPSGSEAGRTVRLTLYDASGANFESERLMAEYNRSIYNSKGLFFMVDPSQLPVLRESRRSKGLGVVDLDPEALLLRTVHLIRSGLGIDSVSKKIPIPLAVCLTKMDTLFPSLDPACFVKDTSRNLRRPMVSAADISSCNLETQSLIENWGGRELVRHVKSQFSDFSFFSLSALGAQPGEQGEIPRVTPHRVLDPLLWLLWRNHIVKAG